MCVSCVGPDADFSEWPGRRHGGPCQDCGRQDPPVLLSRVVEDLEVAGCTQRELELRAMAWRRGTSAATSGCALREAEAVAAPVSAEADARRSPAVASASEAMRGTECAPEVPDEVLGVSLGSWQQQRGLALALRVAAAVAVPICDDAL